MYSTVMNIICNCIIILLCRPTKRRQATVSTSFKETRTMAVRKVETCSKSQMAKCEKSGRKGSVQSKMASSQSSTQTLVDLIWYRVLEWSKSHTPDMWFETTPWLRSNSLLTHPSQESQISFVIREKVSTKCFFLQYWKARKY